MVESDAADLFLLAQRLQDLRSVRAPARLRERTLAQIQASPRTPYVRLAERRQARKTWLTAVSRGVAAASIVIFLGYSSLAASASPLEGPFYFMKVWVEDVRVAVADPDAKPLIYVQQADKRLEETQKLNTTDRVAGAMAPLIPPEAGVSSAAVPIPPDSAVVKPEGRANTGVVAPGSGGDFLPIQSASVNPSATPTPTQGISAPNGGFQTIGSQPQASPSAPTPAATASRSAVPAAATPTTQPPTAAPSTPAGPGVGAPSSGFTVIPPR
jgi:hypothetical protein